MDRIIDILQVPAIFALLQWLVAWKLKQEWKDQIARKFIPLVTLVLSLLGYTLVPSEAHAFVAFKLRLVDPSPLPTVLLALLQTFGVTGAHGAWKNIFQGLALLRKT